MEHSFAEELYSDSLQLSKAKQCPTSTGNGEQHHSRVLLREVLSVHGPGRVCLLSLYVNYVAQEIRCSTSDGDDVWEEDGSSWDDSARRLDKSTDLDREWKRRRDQFFTIGYRDGIIAGKEASAQEGFNIGYKQSVPAGYSWGLVRGVTSALTFLPDGLKERLVEAPEKRDKYQNLYESIHSLSASDALKLFSDEILSNRKTQHAENSEASEQVSSQQGSDPVRMGTYVGELKELLGESPAIEIHSDVPASSMP